MTVKIKKNEKLHYTDGSPVPTVTDIFIDKLFITADYPEADHAQIIQNFYLAKDNNAGYSKKTQYKHNCTLSSNYAAYEGEASIHCLPPPKKKGYYFFRLAMNPARVDLNYIKTELDKILPGGYAGLLAKGRVTRIDLTVDVYDVRIFEIIAAYPQMRVESHYGMGSNKQSKVIGKHNKIITLYDKKQQLTEITKNKSPFTLNLPMPPGHLTRIEIQLNRTNKNLAGILTFPNPFKPLLLVAYPGSMSPKNYDPMWTLFLAACQDHGRKAALTHFSAADKKHYKARLENEGKSDWWKPEELWKGLPAVIDSILNVKGYGPKVNCIGQEPLLYN